MVSSEEIGDVKSEARFMKHYGITALVDFARNLVAEENADSIRAHLSTGCPECSDIINFINKLSFVCHRVAAVSVPDAALRNARSILPASLVSNQADRGG